MLFGALLLFIWVILSLWNNRCYSSLRISCLHQILSVPQQIQDVKGCLISPADILQIGVVIGWVGFLLVLIFMKKFRYLCLTKSIVLPFSAPSSGNNWAQNKLIPRAFSVILLFFLAIAFVLLMSFSWISQTSSTYGQCYLVIKNLPWDLSQSEIENCHNFFFEKY